jgi:hypothetical protein
MEQLGHDGAMEAIEAIIAATYMMASNFARG